MTGSGDLSVAIWDLVDGSLVTRMKSHAASIRAVQVNKFDPCTFLQLCVCVCVCLCVCVCCVCVCCVSGVCVCVFVF